MNKIYVGQITNAPSKHFQTVFSIPYYFPENCLFQIPFKYVLKRFPLFVILFTYLGNVFSLDFFDDNNNNKKEFRFITVL